MRILYFGQASCPQCKVWKPKYEALCRSLDVDFVYNDVEENESLATLYGIRHIPFVILEDESGEKIVSGPAADLFHELEKHK